MLSVRSFCEVERRRYRELVSREHRYVKEKIDEMAAVPFTQVDERVWAMTGMKIFVFSSSLPFYMAYHFLLQPSESNNQLNKNSVIQSFDYH